MCCSDCKHDSASFGRIRNSLEDTQTAPAHPSVSMHKTTLEHWKRSTTFHFYLFEFECSVDIFNTPSNENRQTFIGAKIMSNNNCREE